MRGRTRPTLAVAVALAVTVVGALTLAGCSSVGSGGGAQAATATLAQANPQPVADNPPAQLPATVRSFDGAEVTVTDNSRIVAADEYGTLGATVFALGLGSHLVGRDTATAFPAAQHIPNVTPGGQALNAEAILALHPTVVLTDTSIGPAAVQRQLRQAGIPVVYFDPQRTMNSTPQQIRAVGDALGVPAQAAALAERTTAQIDAAKAAVPKTNPPLKIAFLYMRGTAVSLMGGPGSGADQLIEAMGAVDAGTAAGLTSAFSPITSEALVAAQPDVILMMTEGLKSIGGVDGLEKVPGVAQTPAGRNRRVVDMADSQLLSFGPNTGQVLRALTAAVYGPGQR